MDETKASTKSQIKIFLTSTLEIMEESAENQLLAKVCKEHYLIYKTETDRDDIKQTYF